MEPGFLPNTRSGAQEIPPIVLNSEKMVPIKDISLQSIPSYPTFLRTILIIKIQTDKRI